MLHPTLGRWSAEGALRGAIAAVAAGKAPSPDQRPSVGCNIKWKPGTGPA